jgi:hypothetical protein
MPELAGLSAKGGELLVRYQAKAGNGFTLDSVD